MSPEVMGSIYSSIIIFLSQLAIIFSKHFHCSEPLYGDDDVISYIAFLFRFKHSVILSLFLGINMWFLGISSCSGDSM